MEVTAVRKAHFTYEIHATDCKEIAKATHRITGTGNTVIEVKAMLESVGEHYIAIKPCAAWLLS